MEGVCVRRYWNWRWRSGERRFHSSSSENNEKALYWSCEMKLYNRNNDNAEDKLEAMQDGGRTVVFRVTRKMTKALMYDSPK
jgi:hypothetical protein